MAPLVVNSSDLVLAAGISFWSVVVETHHIQDIHDRYHIINTLKGVLQQKHALNDEGFDAEPSSEENRRKVNDSLRQDIRSDDDLIDPIEKSVEKKRETNLKSSAVNVKIEKSSLEKIEDQETSTDENEKIVHEQSKTIKEDIMHIIKEEKVKVKTNTCDYCEEKFPLFFHLKKHMKSNHGDLMGEFDEKYRTIKCIKCPASFYSSRRHREHKERCHRKDAQCSLCPRSFYSEEELRKHEARHENDRKVFTCDKCDKKIVGIYKFKKHMKNMINHGTAVSCPHCQKLVKDLKKHLKVHDKPTSDVLCDVCGKSFPSERSLTKHNYFCLPGLAPPLKANVKCRFCDSSFTSSMKKSRHEFKAHDHNGQICSQCGHKSLGMRNLKRHLTTHGGREISCDQCGKTFKSQENLKLHQRKMHQSDSEKPHKCSYSDCTRAFVSLSSLESHTNSHLGIRPYQCDFCPTRFQNPSNKIAHKKCS